jgi:glycosyltransferase involved in cell wall biosynthesis
MKNDLHEKLRPFVMVTGDYVRTGGQDAANFALADYLARNDRAVHLVGYRFDESLAHRSNVTLHRVPKPANSYTLSAPLLTASALITYGKLRGVGAALVANGGNCPSPSANWVHYVHAAYRARSVLALQRARQALTHRFNLRNERVALLAAKVIIANSERTRRDVIGLGVSPGRVKTIYYGIDPDRFRIATTEERKEAAGALGWKLDRFRVAFIGALGDRRKGFDVLFEAWKKVSATPQWDGELVVVGAGAEVESWRTKVRENKLENAISILGFRSDVPKILSACDALVSPTRYEAYGLGVHEALCCGLPAIVSADAGVAERYPDQLKHLLLHDVEDASALASLLIDLRKHLEKTKRDVANLSDELRQRTWDVMARDIEALCDSSA